MENKSHALAAGAFVLGVTALLIVMVMWLTRDKTQQQAFELVSREAVSGLQLQAGVRYKGVMVGRVQTIELDPNARGQIRIQISVDKNTPVSTTTFASLGFQGVTGLAFIQLDDDVETSPMLEAEGDALPRIPLRSGLVSRLTEQGGNLMEKVDLITQNMNKLLHADNQKILIGSIHELGQAAASISQLALQVDAVLAQQTRAEQLSLPRMAAQTEATLKSIQASSEKLSESLEAVASRISEPGGTLEKLEQSADVMQFTAQSVHANLMPQINRSAENSVYAVRQLSKIADEVSETPQLLLWGKDAQAPGPGEEGFKP